MTPSTLQDFDPSTICWKAANHFLRNILKNKKSSFIFPL